MSKYSQMAGCLTKEAETTGKTLRQIGAEAGLAPSTVMRALQKPKDLHYSTILRLWGALGFTVTIYCQKEGSKTLYAFEEDTE